MRSGLVAVLAGSLAAHVAPAATAAEALAQATSAGELANAAYVVSARASLAHERGITGAGIRIGILDSGISDATGEFTGRIAGQYDANNGSRTAADDFGHGTKVAGVALAGANGFGTVGFAPDAQLLAIRVYDANRSATNTNIMSGVRYALENGARVINMSFGSPAAAIGEQPVRLAVRSGALVVASAGNFAGANPIWPARFAREEWADGRVLAVGAVDAGNLIASFSNRAGDAKDFYLVAPGVGLQTTCPTAYCSANGTSYSAPAVAGAAALIMGNWAYLTAKQTADILLRSATDLGAPGTDEVYGRGLLNLERALEPLGPVRVYTRRGTSLAAATLQVGSSTALQPALSAAASQGLLNVAGFDDYGRDYGVDLGAGLRARYTGLLENLLAGADRTLGVSEVALGDRASLTTFTDRPLLPAAAMDPLVASMDGYAPRMQAMLLNIDAGAQRLSFGTGGLAQQFFGVGAGTDVAWIGQAIANPLFGMVGNHSHFGVASQLDADTTVRVGMVTGANPLAAAGGLRVDPARLWTTEVARRWGDTRVAIGGSLLVETDGVLGARGGVYAGEHSTQAMQLAVSHRIWPRLAVAAQYTAAATRANDADSDAILKVRGVVAQSWSAGLVASDVLGKDDRLVLAVSQPLVATAGRIDLDASIGVSADGTPVQALRRIDVAGERPLQTELRYSVRLAPDSSVSAAVVHLDQGALTDTAVTFKYTAKF